MFLWVVELAVALSASEDSDLKFCKEPPLEDDKILLWFFN